MFIIRRQGFFYTDEYYAPEKVFRQVVRKTYKTKAAADKACAELVREWVCAETLGNYVFNNRKATDAVVTYLRSEWPEEFPEPVKWLHDVSIPKDATDTQVDELVKRMGVVFAQVFEVEEQDEHEDDDGELYFGPTD